MSIQIKFGTDGWRAIIAKDYTVDNVARVATATAKYLLQQKSDPKVIVGHDCRFGGELFAETTAAVFAQHGIKVLLAKSFVSTPMVSLATFHFKADFGIIITASHNPPSYNGYKIKAAYGGPAVPAVIEEVENLIPDQVAVPTTSVEDYIKKGLVEIINPEDLYVDHVLKNFDINKIQNSGINLIYDAMYGAGQNVMRRLFPEADFLHCDYNPGFEGQAPEPIDKNLQPLSETIKAAGDLHFGLATDGDADRIGLYDENGNFVDSHHIILLLIHYLVRYKKMRGMVVKSFSCTNKIDELCKQYGLQSITTKIGFKYICEYMVNDDVLVGGEESGGIAIKGHIPERDGIWIGLTLLQYMAETGKKLTQLIQELYAIVGEFALDRSDLHISEAQKQKVLANCQSGAYKSFGAYNIARTEDTDGYKYHLAEGGWVMLRASGTEPVLRVYSEAANKQEAAKILAAVKEVVLS